MILVIGSAPWVMGGKPRASGDDPAMAACDAHEAR